MWRLLSAPHFQKVALSSCVSATKAVGAKRPPAPGTRGCGSYGRSSSSVSWLETHLSRRVCAVPGVLSAAVGLLGAHIAKCCQACASAASSPRMASSRAAATTATGDFVRVLIYGGDAMLGRAVNLTLPHQSPGDEHIADSCEAEHYLEMALHGGEQEHGELQRMREQNHDGRRLWGDLLTLQFDPPPDVRLMNLETAVTKTITNQDIPHKGINYHMHIGNLAVFESLAATRHGAAKDVPYVMSFANNHSLDFGRQAFESESVPCLQTLPGQGHIVGAGLNLAQASRPVVLPVRGKVVRIVSLASECSGTPADWAATDDRSGLVWLPELCSVGSTDKAFELCKHVIGASTKNDSLGLLLVSIHWGPNWAYRHHDYQSYRRRLAHRLIDELGVDLIYGHSSHHVRGMEVHSGKLVIYGAGDLVNDYEGFQNPGDEAYSRLGGVFCVDLASDTGNVNSIRIVPMVMDRLALRRMMTATTVWSARTQSFRPSTHGVISEFACKVNELSLSDAASKWVAPTFELHLDSETFGVLPPGPVLTWP